MEANPFGEVVMEFGEESYLCRMTFKGLSRLDQSMSKGTGQAASANIVANGGPTIPLEIAFVGIGIGEDYREKHHGKVPDESAIGQLLFACTPLQRVQNKIFITKTIFHFSGGDEQAAEQVAMAYFGDALELREREANGGVPDPTESQPAIESAPASPSLVEEDPHLMMNGSDQPSPMDDEIDE